MRSSMSSNPTLNSSPKPSEVERKFQTVDELVEATQQKWQEEFEQKKQKWDKMTHEQRVAYIKTVFDRFLQKAAANPEQAAAEFMQWLISPDGALAWPYIWKPEYRLQMINITSKAYRLALKYLGPR